MSSQGPKENVTVRDSISEFAETLASVFGNPVWTRKPAIDELMLTILSQNTNDRNRDNAYKRLRKEFPTWEDVRVADVAAVEEAIRPAGLSNQKSVRMVEVLNWLMETFGSLDLSQIRELSDDDAIQLMTSRKGIGVKTAAVLLAFSLDRDLCPVDTHVHRIAQRLGWVPEGVSAEKTFYLIRQRVPAGKAAAFHLNLLKFGRTICTARSPHCKDCPVLTSCPFQGKKLSAK